MVIRAWLVGSFAATGFRQIVGDQRVVKEHEFGFESLRLFDKIGAQVRPLGQENRTAGIQGNRFIVAAGDHLPAALDIDETGRVAVELDMGEILIEAFMEHRGVAQPAKQL